MTRYTIFPADRSLPPLDMLASNRSSVLDRISQRGWREADVCHGDEYAFSVRIGDAGFWTVFERAPDDRPRCTMKLRQRL
jgi:hypothetical protein